ncbi:cell division protein FtsK [Pseudomonas sp. B392_1p]|uniref:cell division protein FtsK n=1 Tax=Pseudomonas sp. B392_1p TaxID=3457507 RepID=UPI003FD2CE4C
MTAQAVNTLAERIANEMEELLEQAAPTPFEMASETLGRDLLQVLLQEVRTLPEPWQKMPEKRQAAVIERLTDCVESTVKKAVKILAAGGRPTIDGILESVAIKDGIKATFKVSQFNPLRHELIDSQGKVCLLVVANPDDYLGGMDEVAPDPDQNELELNGGDQDMQDPGAWDGGTVVGINLDAERVDIFGGYSLTELATSIALRKETIDLAYLQSRYALPYDEAKSLLLRLLDTGVITLETEGAQTSDQNIYRVAKKADDLNLE